MRTRTIIAALVLACISHHPPAIFAAGPAGADDQAAAAALNARARAAYDGGDFAGALALFKEAWGEARLPRYVFNAAKACLRLEDHEAALHYFRRYLDAAPAAEDRDAVEAEMEALRAMLRSRGLVRLDLFSEPGGALFTVDGAAHPEIARTPAELWLPPGDVIAAATLEGRTGAAETVTLAPGRAARATLSLPELPRAGRIIVDAPPAAAITVGDWTAAPGEALELAPGDYPVRVDLPGHQPWLDTVTLASGDTVRVEAVPVPLPPPVRGKSMRVAGWATLAAGGAALLAGGVMTGLGVEGMRDANASHDGPDAGYVRDYGAGRDLYHGGLGVLGGAAAAAATGGLLLLLAPEDVVD